MGKPILSLGSILGLFLLSTSCQALIPTPGTTPTTQVSPSVSVSPQALPTAGGEITLSIWAPPNILGSQAIGDFAQADPQIQIDLVPKKPYGVGGILDFLLTTSVVVPDGLPDVVLIDASQLAALREKGIVQAIDSRDFPGISEDLYPFAVSATTINGQAYALPALASLEHLAYDLLAIASPPKDWEELQARGRGIALPLASQDGEISDAFILQYLALGGRVLEANGQPTLSQALLARTLQFFLELKKQGLLKDDALETDPAAAIQSLVDGGVVLAEVSSRDNLARGLEVGFAGVPTGLGSSATIARVWAFAITTPDARKQVAAATFINWMLEPERLASWAMDQNWIPAHRSLLKMAIDEGSYRDFLTMELETAYARPPIPPNIAEAMHQALVDVLSEDLDPQQAAEKAVESLGAE